MAKKIRCGYVEIELNPECVEMDRERIFAAESPRVVRFVRQHRLDTNIDIARDIVIIIRR